MTIRCHRLHFYPYVMHNVECVCFLFFLCQFLSCDLKCKVVAEDLARMAPSLSGEVAVLLPKLGILFYISLKCCFFISARAWLLLNWRDKYWYSGYIRLVFFRGYTIWTQCIIGKIVHLSLLWRAVMRKVQRNPDLHHPHLRNFHLSSKCLASHCLKALMCVDKCEYAYMCSFCNLGWEIGA